MRLSDTSRRLSDRDLQQRRALEVVAQPRHRYHSLRRQQLRRRSPLRRPLARAHPTHRPSHGCLQRRTGQKTRRGHAQGRTAAALLFSRRLVRRQRALPPPLGRAGRLAPALRAARQRGEHAGVAREHRRGRLARRVGREARGGAGQGGERQRGRKAREERAAGEAGEGGERGRGETGGRGGGRGGRRGGGRGGRERPFASSLLPSASQSTTTP